MCKWVQNQQKESNGFAFTYEKQTSNKERKETLLLQQQKKVSLVAGLVG